MGEEEKTEERKPIEPLKASTAQLPVWQFNEMVIEKINEISRVVGNLCMAVEYLEKVNADKNLSEEERLAQEEADNEAQRIADAEDLEKQKEKDKQIEIENQAGAISNQDEPPAII